MQFKLATQIFDAFGETVDNYSVHNLYTTTDTDVDRQFLVAEVKLGNEGNGMVYGNKYIDESNPSGFKIDVILFVADEECINALEAKECVRFLFMKKHPKGYNIQRVCKTLEISRSD